MKNETKRKRNPIQKSPGMIVVSLKTILSILLVHSKLFQPSDRT